MPNVAHASDCTNAPSFEQLARIIGNRARADAPCPVCSPHRKKQNQMIKVLRVWAGDNPHVLTFACQHCGASGYRVDGQRTNEVDHKSARRDVENRKLDDDPERNQRLALDLWRQARPPAGTPVQLHLKRRGLALPACDDIRFAPEHPFGKDANGVRLFVPAMLCLVRNIITNEPHGIHRTALTRDGVQRRDLGRNGRLTLGTARGGAVKLTPDAEVTHAIGIGEGVETTLSLALLPEWRCGPVWSLLSKGGIASVPVLPGIETLVIAVDHDQSGDGETAARAVAERWQDAGREVFFCTPRAADADLNDVIQRGAL